MNKKQTKKIESKVANVDVCESDLNTKTTSKCDKIWRWVFIAVSAISLISMIIMSTDAGMSGDEHFHTEQAENVYNYYATFGQDSTAAVVTPDYNLPYYGQSVDNLAYFITKTFGIEDEYGTRHIVNSIFGWLAMFFVALIAYRIAGWRAAVITFALIFLSPRFLGHSFNNLKDLPLATGMAFGVYCLVRFLQEFPKIKVKTAILFALSIGFAISVRFAGLLIVAYFGLFGAIYWFIRNKKQGLFKGQGLKELKSMLGWGIAISFVGIIISILLWPFLLKSPINNFIDTMENMTQFAIAIRQVFEGEMQWSDMLPWYYTPKFVLMTIPLAVIAGLIFHLILMWSNKKNIFWSTLILFTFVFPIFWIIYQKSNVYGGWRHAMFSYPTMVVFAGLGFDYAINMIKDKRAKIALTILPFALLIMPLCHIIKNHPYQYVYFNELAGGVENAWGNYELDYYYHSTREASEWVIENAQTSDMQTDEKIRVATWHVPSVQNYFRHDTNRFKVVFSRWYQKGNVDWDYAIFTLTGISPEYMKSDAFPPKNTVYTVEVDNKPICLVLKRTSKDDYKASLLKEKGKADSAVMYYNMALNDNPFNETALLNLGEIYLHKARPDSAAIYLNRFLAFDPNDDNGNYFLAYTYLMQNNPQKAAEICENILKHNYKYAGAYSILKDIYIRQNNLFGAEQIMLRMIDADQLDETFVPHWVAINKAQGLDERAAYIKLYKALVASYEKRGKHKEAKIYQEYLQQLI